MFYNQTATNTIVFKISKAKKIKTKKWEGNPTRIGKSTQ